MKLKDKLLTSFFELENKAVLNVDASIHDMRIQAIDAFEKKGFPTKKDEEWKYTSLQSLLKKDYIILPNSDEITVELKDVKKYVIHEMDTYKIVFIDGVYSSFLSETTHAGIDVCLLSSAIAKPKYRMVMDHYFNKIAKNNESFTDLNTAFAKEGAFIHITKNTIVPKPIQLLYFSTKDVFLQPRNLVIVDENSHVQIIERHQNLNNNSVLTNSLTEIYANKRAIVDYYKIQNDLDTASLIDQTFVQQKDNSIVSVNTFSFGGKITRNNLEFYQEGERIESNLNGFTLIGEKQVVDNHTLVKHQQPNCESHELYKGIYADKATGVFNGKVIVDKIAQQTNAFQQNNTILIGEKASINAKPQLEIFADDVKCSHGCTIGQLDEKALFYMQQRGIPKKEAKALLLYAFGNDVIEKIKLVQVKKRITKLIANKLGVEMGV